MIGLVIALIIGIPVFYGCMLATVAFARHRAVQHTTATLIGQWRNIESYDVNVQHCFWCAFWVHAAKGISGQ